MPTFSILVASSGRPSLSRTLESITPQMLPGDELIVDVNDDAPWGHKARNRMTERAKGDWIAYMDDDDRYSEGAFEAMREGVVTAPERVHIFRMHYHIPGNLLWTEPVLREGNLSTQMFVFPNIPGKLGQFSDAYEGDWYCCRDTCELLGPPVWHEAVIAYYRC